MRHAPPRTLHVVDPVPPRFLAIDLSDLDTLVAIENAAYPFPWSRGNFADSLHAGYLARKRVDATGRWLGYFIAMPGVQEVHLLNLTVAPEHQRQGHALAMLDELVRGIAGCQRARCVRRGPDRFQRDKCVFERVRQPRVHRRIEYLQRGGRRIHCRKETQPADRLQANARMLVVYLLDKQLLCVGQIRPLVRNRVRRSSAGI